MPRRSTSQKINRKEQAHAKKFGSAFDHALQITTMVVRSSTKLVGLDTIRAPIAWQAALKATGYPEARVPYISIACRDEGDNPHIQTIICELFETAVKAARAARDVVIRAGAA